MRSLDSSYQFENSSLAFVVSAQPQYWLDVLQVNVLVVPDIYSRTLVVVLVVLLPFELPVVYFCIGKTAAAIVKEVAVPIAEDNAVEVHSSSEYSPTSDSAVVVPTCVDLVL